MTLSDFARDYDQLPPGEQALFAETLRRLLTNGLVWREDEDDRKAYAFLARRSELIQQYLAVAGWQLRHFEPGRIYHVFHAEGAHRRRLSLKTTRWLLVLRLIYAEKREKLEATLTRHPTVTVGDVYERYLAFFPGQKVREKTSLDEALRTLQGLRLIRAAGGGYLRAADTDKTLELLPALEVVVPAQAIAEVADRLREYQAEPADDAVGDDLSEAL